MRPALFAFALALVLTAPVLAQDVPIAEGSVVLVSTGGEELWVRISDDPAGGAPGGVRVVRASEVAGSALGTRYRTPVEIAFRDGPFRATVLRVSGFPVRPSMAIIAGDGQVSTDADRVHFQRASADAGVVIGISSARLRALPVPAIIR